MVEQLRPDATAAHRRVDQHHADPAEPSAVAHGGHGADDVAFMLGDGTAVGTERKKLLPVPADLVPSADAAEPKAGVDIGRAHRPQHLADRIPKRRIRRMLQRSVQTPKLRRPVRDFSALC